MRLHFRGATSMTARVFISYRRDDSNTSGMVYAAFTNVLARENVFMDIDTIPPGPDFVALLEGWVINARSCWP